MSRIHDCKPTLNDRQVLDFCRNGYMVLPAVVPDEVNRRTVEFMAEHADSLEPVEVLGEEWFDEGVIKNPEAAGAVRSLLGRDFLTPNMISSHRTVGPTPAQNWHPDAGSIITHRLDYLQVFYYPSGATKEMGPHRDRPGLAHESRQGGDARTAQEPEDLQADDLASGIHRHHRLLYSAPQERQYLYRNP